MGNGGFNPEDVADSISRFSRDRKKENGARSTTAGIPDFVPRTVVQKRNESIIRYRMTLSGPLPQTKQLNKCKNLSHR